MLPLDRKRWLEIGRSQWGCVALIFLVMLVLAVVYYGLTYWDITYKSPHELWRNTEYYGIGDIAFYQNNLVFSGTSAKKNLGRCFYGLDKKSNQLVWSTDRIDDVRSISTVNGSLIVVDADKVLYALDNSGGNILWRRKSYAYSPIALSDANVFTVHYPHYMEEGSLTAQDQESGEILWNIPLLTHPFYVEATEKDEILLTYFDSMLFADIRSEDNHQLVAINSDTGKLIWKLRLRSDSLFQSYSGDMLYLINTDDRESGSYFTAYDLHSGRKVWEVFFADLNPHGSDSPVLVDGHIILGINTKVEFWSDVRYIVSERKLIALDADSGEISWSFSNAPVREKITHFVRDNVVYIGVESGWLYAVDIEAGKELWKTEVLGFPLIHSLENNILIVSTEDNHISGFNKDNGMKLWEFISKNLSIASEKEPNPPDVIVKNGILYVATETPRMYALDIKNGKELWRWQDSIFPWYSAYKFVGVDNESVYVIGDYSGLFALKTGP